MKKNFTKSNIKRAYKNAPSNLGWVGKEGLSRMVSSSTKKQFGQIREAYIRGKESRDIRKNW